MNALTTSRISEEEALSHVVEAGSVTACPVHVIGPLANHIIGPVSALRPDFHPVPSPRLARSKETVDRLIRQTAGGIRCTCPDGYEPSELLVVLPKISDGAHVRSRQHTMEVQATVESAIHHIENLDESLLVLDPRLDCLILLTDLARAGAGGGDLDARTIASVETLARTLIGAGRWDVREGHSQGMLWPAPWRMGIADETADRFLRYPELVKPTLSRLLTGR